MPDIRYVCLSDMHLGTDRSVLTNLVPDSLNVDATQPSPVMQHFVTCLRELIGHNEGPKKPILVLNGDILEMALSETNVAAMIFERFIELIFPPDGEALFDKNILYIPGNHDHHIWENARETQYVNFIADIPAGKHLPPPWHTTKLFPAQLTRGYFLTDLIQRQPHLKDTVISIIYPNYGLLDSAGQRCVLFHHGHYVEPLYSLMSTLNTMIFPGRVKPSIVWDLEAENFAWIDFFWSTMGRSGSAGLDIGLLYDKLQDEKQIDKLIENFSASLVEQFNHLKFLEGIETFGLSKLLSFLFSKGGALERNRPAQSLSPEAQQGLRSYMEGPLLNQLRVENGGEVPTDITFIFGHTHKPFSQDMHFAGYPLWTNVYNSGGWVVDTVQPKSIYGAAVILIDEALQTTALRMYSQAASPDQYTVRVEESTHADAGNNTFYERIKTLVEPSNEPWKTFSQTVAEALGVREQILQTKINL